ASSSVGNTTPTTSSASYSSLASLSSSGDFEIGSSQKLHEDRNRGFVHGDGHWDALRFSRDGLNGSSLTGFTVVSKRRQCSRIEIPFIPAKAGIQEERVLACAGTNGRGSRASFNINASTPARRAAARLAPAAPNLTDVRT